MHKIFRAARDLSQSENIRKWKIALKRFRASRGLLLYENTTFVENERYLSKGSVLRAAFFMKKMIGNERYLKKVRAARGLIHEENSKK